MIRTAMVQLLDTMGYESLTAATINEAHEQLRRHAPSAVLVDHHLKGDDGFAAVPEMRKVATASGEDRSPLFIGMSGSGSIDEQETTGLDGCLVKPFSPEQLNELLKGSVTGS